MVRIGVCPPPDEKEIIALESAATCCGYSVYTYHTPAKEKCPDFRANSFPQKSPTNLPGELEGKKNYCVKFLLLR